MPLFVCPGEGGKSSVSFLIDSRVFFKMCVQCVLCFSISFIQDAQKARDKGSSKKCQCFLQLPTRHLVVLILTINSLPRRVLFLFFQVSIRLRNRVSQKETSKLLKTEKKRQNQRKTFFWLMSSSSHGFVLMSYHLVLNAHRNSSKTDSQMVHVSPSTPLAFDLPVTVTMQGRRNRRPTRQISFINVSLMDFLLCSSSALTIRG